MADNSERVGIPERWVVWKAPKRPLWMAAQWHSPRAIKIPRYFHTWREAMDFVQTKVEEAKDGRMDTQHGP